MTGVGVVAIGRNEGERLRRCLQSVVAKAQHVVYVDSGSTDGSVELAKALSVEVVQLDLSRPFTAARSRNEGFARLMQIAPDLQFVQFIDSDCEVADVWIPRAIDELSANPQVAVVCGRRRERYPDATIYNALCDMEWNTPIGDAKACGGDAMMRTVAFQQAGGYDASVIAGEEPELCVRLRKAGWTIRRIDSEMTLHDAAMTRFGQWWKRNFRAGHAYAQGNAMHGDPPERFRKREVDRNVQWGIVLPVITIVATIALLFIRPILSWVPTVIALGLYALLAIKVTIGRRNAGDSLGRCAMYGFFIVLGKFPQALGQIKFWRNRAKGQQTQLIEYKGPEAIKA